MSNRRRINIKIEETMKKQSDKLNYLSSKNSTGEESEINYSEIIMSLVSESAYLGDILECSLELMELFDPDEMVDCVNNRFNKSCDGEFRIWRFGDDEILLIGKNPPPLPTDEKELISLKEKVKLASKEEKELVTVEGEEFLLQRPYILEMVNQGKGQNPFYLASLYFRHLVRAFDYLKDRLVLVKAFREIQELLELKSKVEGSLQDIQNHSNFSIGKISEALDKIYELSHEIKENKEISDSIRQAASQALNETQIGDINNQRIFASLHNLERLFLKLKDSLDPISKSYFDSMYTPLNVTDEVENLVSASLVERDKKSDQSSVDDLLAELGL